MSVFIYLPSGESAPHSLCVPPSVMVAGAGERFHTSVCRYESSRYHMQIYTVYTYSLHCFLHIRLVDHKRNNSGRETISMTKHLCTVIRFCYWLFLFSLFCLWPLSPSRAHRESAGAYPRMHMGEGRHSPDMSTWGFGTLLKCPCTPYNQNTSHVLPTSGLEPQPFSFSAQYSTDWATSVFNQYFWQILLP